MSKSAISDNGSFVIGRYPYHESRRQPSAPEGVIQGTKIMVSRSIEALRAVREPAIGEMVFLAEIIDHGTKKWSGRCRLPAANNDANISATRDESVPTSCF